MRGAPVGQPGLQPLGPAQTEQCASGAEPQPRTVTSRSLTLAGRGFRLDFTWRREERDQPVQTAAEAPARTASLGSAQYDRNARPVPSPPRVAAPAPKASSPGRRDASSTSRSFADILRRQQLAGLVMMPSRPPADRLLLQGPMAVADPQPGPVCRAYGESLGPLGSPASRLYTV